MTDFAKKINLQFNKLVGSGYYIPLIVLLALVFYTTGLDLIGMILFSVLIGAGLLFTDNAKYALPPLFTILFQLSFQHVTYKDNAFYTQPPTIICFAIAAVILIVSMVAFIIKKHKTDGNLMTKRPSRLFISMLIMVLSMLTAGLFHSPFDFMSLAYASGIGALFVVFYLLFTVIVDNTEQTRIYSAQCMVAVMALVSLEIAVFYAFKFGQYNIMNSTWKGNMALGWGISNTAGALIVMLIPAAYYLIYKNVNVTFNYCAVFIAINAVYFTLSRAALLIGLPLVVTLAIFCFIKNKQSRKKIGLLTTAFILTEAALVAIIVLTDNVKTFTDFFISTSTSDNGTIVPDTRGRTELWKGYIEMFKTAPVFGVGFYNAFRSLLNPNMTLFSGMAHNTIIQFLGSCGIFGILAYLYHRTETIIINVKNYSIEKLLLSMEILALVLMSLFDVFFISPYFIIFYDLILVLCEKFDQKDCADV